MKKFDFIKHLECISAKFLAEYKLAETYRHRGGRGEIRETILTDWLNEFLPDNISVTKGEIVDSNLNRSKEFDIIVYLKSGIPKLFSSQEKRVIPVENVLTVIEVKSKLNNKNYIVEFGEKLSELNEFSRYFKPTQLYAQISRITGNPGFSEEPLKANEARKGVGRISGGLFAFEACSQETVSGYLNAIDSPANFSWVFVLEKCFWLYDLSNNSWDAKNRIKVNPLLFLAFSLIELCKDKERFIHVEPNFARYMDNTARYFDENSVSRRS